MLGPQATPRRRVHYAGTAGYPTVKWAALGLPLLPLGDHPLLVAIAPLSPSLSSLTSWGISEIPRDLRRRLGLDGQWKRGSTPDSRVQVLQSQVLDAFRDCKAERARGNECRLSPDTARHF
jgi:hypothetical protein